MHGVYGDVKTSIGYSHILSADLTNFHKRTLDQRPPSSPTKIGKLKMKRIYDSKDSKHKASPIIFEEVHFNNSEPENEVVFNESICDVSAIEGFHSYDGAHLLVLVAGFEGCGEDMAMIRNNLRLVYPDAIVICSSIND